MAGTIIMPKSGMAMEEGVIIKWLKKEGDKIEKGEPVLEVETDKSTMEVEADYEGTLLKIVYNEGDTVPVTEVVGWIGEPGEEIPEAAKKPAAAASGSAGISAPAASAADGESTAGADSTAGAAAQAAVSESGRVKATPAARRIAKEKNIDLTSVYPGGKYGEVRAADVAAAKTVKATPLAGRIAEREGVELAGLAGSGKDGKIFSKDIAAALAAKRAAAEAEDSGAGSLEPERIKLNNIQRITGKRMLASHLELPPVTVNAEADVTDLLAVRKELNAGGDMHITVNDFVLKAVVRALLKNPRMNASLGAASDTEAAELLLYPYIHLGVAVATPKGLLVPVIRNAERKTLLQLSREMAEIRGKAADGKLNPDDLTGSTFTVSNIGKYGVTSFTPIINQPEAGILGVCAIQDRLARIDGEITDRKILGLSLTFDHRIVDGAESAEFMQTLVGLLEKPVTALV